MHNLLEELNHLMFCLKEALHNAQTTHDVDAVRTAFLGRKGSLTELMGHLKDLPIELKKIVGPQYNQAKQEAMQICAEKYQSIATKAPVQTSAMLDVTALPYNKVQGSIHPYTLITQELEDIFISMGYAIVDGPELEHEQYNFTALNIPPDHPARDMHDTFWIANHLHQLLRTHTSTVQIHAMERQQPPIALFATGRTYRNEATDASHDFMFMQGECLYVDKNVSMSHLLATAESFLSALFNSNRIKIRVRPSYFPFVEPGVEIDASCAMCRNGCSVCKHTGWIEVLGAGMVHPHVLRSCGIDSHVYTGFAMGFGITRLAMLKYGITDIRLLHSNKIEFLGQFNRMGC